MDWQCKTLRSPDNRTWTISVCRPVTYVHAISDSFHHENWLPVCLTTWENRTNAFRVDVLMALMLLMNAIREVVWSKQEMGNSRELKRDQQSASLRNFCTCFCTQGIVVENYDYWYILDIFTLSYKADG